MPRKCIGYTANKSIGYWYTMHEDRKMRWWGHRFNARHSVGVNPKGGLKRRWKRLLFFVVGIGLHSCLFMKTIAIHAKRVTLGRRITAGLLSFIRWMTSLGSGLYLLYVLFADYTSLPTICTKPRGGATPRLLSWGVKRIISQQLHV